MTKKWWHVIMFNVTDSTSVVNQIVFLILRILIMSMVFKRPAKFRNYVESVYFRSSKVNKKVCQPQPPTPRPCVHCHEVIGSRALMHLHVQVVHRDILDKRKRTVRRLERQLERQMGSTVRNQADAPISFTKKMMLDTSISQSKSVRPIQGKVGIVEQLKTCEMEDMNVQTGDGRRTKTTVTSHRSVCRKFIFEVV